MTWVEIEAKRKQLGVSRSELCRRAGVSESTAYKGLRHSTPPRPVTLACIQKVLRDIETEGAARGHTGPA